MTGPRVGLLLMSGYAPLSWAHSRILLKPGALFLEKAVQPPTHC